MDVGGWWIRVSTPPERPLEFDALEPAGKALHAATNDPDSPVHSASVSMSGDGVLQAELTIEEERQGAAVEQAVDAFRDALVAAGFKRDQPGWIGEKLAIEIIAPLPK